ncbi:progranulin [Emydura macquarii macquarii]|uniref:progranulin n=1 Tax=Emydura macquarii macquarii TaxID=1129001 RepID=UPI00352B19F6
MWFLVPLWLALAGAVTSLRCPDGRLCEGLDVCCLEPGRDSYTCCPLSLASPHSLPMTQASSVADPAGTMCPDGTRCPVEYSCLRTSAGSFGCCPLAEAVSCADGHHCCPRGSHCGMDGKTCFTLPGLPAAGAVQCPDGESECPNDSTCCMMPSGSWGCCPMPQAACCADRIHCCPHATTCDLAHARCLSASGEQPMGTKVPARKRAPWPGVPASLGKIICPDQKSACPDGTTCCQLPNSQYGCCPLQNAVCCSDRLHCCPQDTSCDLPHSKCTSLLGQTQPLPQLLAASETAPAVTCDEESSCPDGNTCCMGAGGRHCCPTPEAVCCQDHVHCCPKGYTCDPAAGSCQPPGAPVPWLEKTPARVRATLAGRDVQCDLQTSCPDGDTCCRLATGQWGCCPIAEAVCCQDHVHCCPKGYTCDPAAGSCQPPSAPILWLEKTPARVRATLASRDVKCDEQTSCPDGDTCCRLATGQWGCCPIAEAVCCQDHVHCCPKGYTCDPAAGSCQPPGAPVLWLEKTPARVRATLAGRDVKCDEQTSCPDGDTCCRLATGQWGCCPTAEAVCCQDHVHCCPKGYTCDPAAGSCQPPGAPVLWLEKTPARVRATLVGRDVQCDEQTSCPDGDTCCRLATGQWGCCPTAEAVCCQDHVHCCPKGYTCDPAAGSCQPPGAPVLWLEKTPARVRASLAGRDVQCDEQTSCPDGDTCCRLATGQWGCCPIAEAVCCQDHVHCCPKGYTCDPAAGSCQPPGAPVPWLEKTPARVRATLAGRDVQCDLQSSCPDGDTCCRLATGQWGCCPIAEAVCCQDHVHCCPKGYTCDPAAGSCQPPGTPVPWLEKTPARVRATLEGRGVRCDEQTSCEDGQTCCKNPTGSWACCRLPNAVCCEDHQHCCPSGYTCNLAAQTCEKQQALPGAGSSSAPLLLASPEPGNGAEVPCDAQHYCRRGQTCCRAASGAWACCPYSKGTCCADQRHCCPRHYRCSASGLDCVWHWALHWAASFAGPPGPPPQPLL